MASVKAGSLAAESRGIFMGDAIVAVNDTWCLESSYDEVNQVLQGAGDTVVLSVASAYDIDRPGSRFYLDSDESE